MKSFLQRVSVILLVAMSISSAQIVCMAQIKQGWERAKSAVSPSQQLQRLKSALTCVSTNSCTPEDIRNIKISLAALTALIATGIATRAAIEHFGGKTLENMMDKYYLHHNSRGYKSLVALNAQPAQNSPQFNELISNIRAMKGDPNSFGALSALREFALSMKNYPGSETIVKEVNSILRSF